jgi:hypothetical protein
MRRVATIANLEDDTSEDRATGAVRSVQGADLFLEVAALRQIWSPVYLERLARTYWRFLSRVTLGLVRVRYTEGERSIVLIGRPLKLLTFHAPEYEMSPSRGLVRWRIARGLLVSKRGRDGGGYLQIEVVREPLGTGTAAPTARAVKTPDTRARTNIVAEMPVAETPRADKTDEGATRARLHVEVEVANFYPSIASGISRRIYSATQSRIHVIITNRFLRSLARLDLAESRVGRFSELRTD